MRRGKNPLDRLSPSKSTVLAFGGGGSAASAPNGKQISLSMSAPSASPKVRTHRFLRPRFIVPTLILLLAFAVVGVYVVRINQAFNTINSMSTPSYEISGEALGGSPDLKIDTAPAKTALAAGGGSSGGGNVAAAIVLTESTTAPTETVIEPTATRSPGTNPPTSAPAETTAGPAVVPTETVIPPTTAPTEEPVEPTATPIVLSQIERVKNGDFELIDSSWYLEQGASVTTGDAHSGGGLLQIDTSGGYADQRLFFIPGTTYHVTAWARLSTADAEEAQIGVTFVNESGDAIATENPVQFVIDSQEWTEFSFSYVPPAGTADVKIFFWKPSGTATLSIDDVSVRSVVTEAAMSVDVQPSDPGSMTILLMGVDARPGEAIDIGVRPDSLMVLHLSAESGSCRVLSIPRDTRTELPGYGLTKVNHALAVGGIEYARQVIEQMLGIEIDHYVLVDFNGFQDMVDAVGGITVTVPETFVSDDGREFPAGQLEMNGEEALSYSRWRGGVDGDFGRMERQQQVLRALVARASGLNVVRSINELLPAVEENLRTDLSPTQMANIAMDYRSRCTESTISMIRLEGSAATYDDPLLQLRLYYIEVDQAEIRSKVAALFEP